MTTAVNDPNEGESMTLPDILRLLRKCQKHLAYHEEWPSISSDVRMAADYLERVITFKQVEARHRDAIYDDNTSNQVEMLLDEERELRSSFGFY